MQNYRFPKVSLSAKKETERNEGENNKSSNQGNQVWPEYR